MFSLFQCTVSFFQCLVLALGHKEITEMRLSGHDVESLAELALNKFSNVSRNIEFYGFS